MPMLSEDDVNLRDLSAEELDAAWDLWFDLAQTTNDADPPYSHGVFVNTPRLNSGQAVTRAPHERSAIDRTTGPRGSAIAILADGLYREEVLRARAMSPEDKLLEGPRLFERACRIMTDGIRHQHPNLDNDGIAALLRGRLDRVSALERS
jgi:hypothetical protein